MGMPAPLYYSAEMVRELPDDGNVYETVYGELLVKSAPRPWHEVVQDRLRRALQDYIAREGLQLYVLGSRADISWGPDILVQPDVFVVPLAQLRTLDWSSITDLRLVAEVLSPSSVRADRFTKRRLYQDQRIPLYWVIDPDARAVEIWAPDSPFPVADATRLVWQPAGAAREFSLNLVELFRPL
jgi:Uma2 family endonuclease